MSNSNNIRAVIIGHAAMLSANVIWGLMSALGKDALNSPDIHPITLAGLRIIGAALLFWAGSLFLPQSIAPKEKVEKCDYKHFVVAALLITFANQMCIIFGLSMTSPIEGTVMCSTSPFFTLILAWFILKTKHTWQKIVGVLLGFGGMMVFIFGGSTDTAMHVDNPMLGNLIVMASQVFGAIYLVRYMFLARKYSPFTLMKWFFTITGTLMLVISGPSIVSTPWETISVQVLLEVGYVVVFGTFLAYIFLPMGQSVLSPTSIAMYNYLQPVVAAVFSIAIGVATITTSTVLGSALIFTGVYLVNKKWNS